jgi:hypothetical protein
MESIMTGVAVGVIMVVVQLTVTAIREKRGKGKASMQILLKCVLILLCAAKKSGIVNGDCDEVLGELNDFLIKK